jgi:hypothetical protein
MSVHLSPLNVLVFGNPVLIKASRTLKCIAVSAAKRKSGTMNSSGLILRLIIFVHAPNIVFVTSKNGPSSRDIRIIWAVGIKTWGPQHPTSNTCLATTSMFANAN